MPLAANLANFIASIDLLSYTFVKLDAMLHRVMNGDMSDLRLVTAVNLVILKLRSFSLLLMISHSYSVCSKSDLSLSILAESIKSHA